MLRALTIFLLFGGLGHAAFSEPGLTLTIEASGWGTDNGYRVGKPVMIRCEIKNHSKMPVSFLLQDHHEYHGTLPYPTTMSATVRDSHDELLVEHWSQYRSWSTMFPEMPGDRITLMPNESVVRIVPLDEILMGSPIKLSAGTYRVHLGLGEIESNQLTVTLKQDLE